MKRMPFADAASAFSPSFPVSLLQPHGRLLRSRVQCVRLLCRRPQQAGGQREEPRASREDSPPHGNHQRPLPHPSAHTLTLTPANTISFSPLASRQTVPYTAVATAGAVNAVAMRRNELRLPGCLHSVWITKHATSVSLTLEYTSQHWHRRARR